MITDGKSQGGSPGSGYPPDRKPNKLHALHVIKDMMLSGAAQSMGSHAALLVAAVASVEDETRYRAAPDFFNEQLLRLIGLRKWEALEKARAAAIDHGYLCYLKPPQGSKKPGIYWTKLPDDTTVIPPDYIREADSEGDSHSPRNGYGGGYSGGYGGGELPYPSPDPNPKESAPPVSEETEKPVKAKRKPRKLNFGNDDWKTAEWMRDLVHEFNPEARNPELGKWADEIRKMRKIEKRTDERIREVFQWAMANEFWQGKMSGPKYLREKFGTLTGQMKTEKAKQQPSVASQQQKRITVPGVRP